LQNARPWLNDRVRPNRKYRKYRLPATPHSRNSEFLWVLVVLALGALAWIWWHAGKPKDVPRKKTVAKQMPAVSRTNAVVRTSLVSTNQGYPRAVQNIFEAQLVLERRDISCGSMDGSSGSQTRAAIRAFQRQQKIPISGQLDAETKSKLLLSAPAFTTYAVTSNDLARLQPLSKTWLGKSQQSALDFETVLELVAEKSHAHPALIRRLNPNVNWTNVIAGTVLQVPDFAAGDPPPGKAAFVKISLSEKFMEAFDEQTNLLAHFPCSIARRVEKRPVGELHVSVIAPHPNYTFDPALFPESPEAQRIKAKLLLPPGPNNPVGTVWIGLDRPGYGMHGTPNPEQVGRTESHGCFRLANWNAERLLKLAWIGMPVYVEQ
jgi:lipoprotein-anchoring transpeptidase ErfK/SrfK